MRTRTGHVTKPTPRQAEPEHFHRPGGIHSNELRHAIAAANSERAQYATAAPKKQQGITDAALLHRLMAQVMRLAADAQAMELAVDALERHLAKCQNESTCDGTVGLTLWTNGRDLERVANEWLITTARCQRAPQPDEPGR